MTQEDKELLLKDLCTRLPYGVKVDIIYNKEHGSSDRLRICSEGCLMLNTDVLGLYIEDEIYLKPYLRPMSSMTEEEEKEISILLNYEFYVDDDCALVAEDERHRIRLDLMQVYIDWLNKHHFDYRGLIEKGLALEATEGMYN